VRVRAAEDEGLLHPRRLQPRERVLDHRHVHQRQQHLRRSSDGARARSEEPQSSSAGHEIVLVWDLGSG
jgi:hypothetical protein